MDIETIRVVCEGLPVNLKNGSGYYERNIFTDTKGHETKLKQVLLLQPESQKPFLSLNVNHKIKFEKKSTASTF